MYQYIIPLVFVGALGACTIGPSEKDSSRYKVDIGVLIVPADDTRENILFPDEATCKKAEQAMFKALTEQPNKSLEVFYSGCVKVEVKRISPKS